MKVRVLKLKSINSTMSRSLEFLWLTYVGYDSSYNVMYCDICRKAGPDIARKTKFVTGKKKFKRESLVYHYKTLKQNVYYTPRKQSLGGIQESPCPSVRPFVRPDIDAWFVRLSPPTVLELNSFNILQDVYTHNGGVHVHRILIFFKYSQNDRQLDLSHVFHTSCIKGTWFVRLTPPTVLEIQL